MVQNLNLGFDFTDTERHKIIIKKVNSESKIYVYDEIGLVGNISGGLITNTFDKNLLIGCYQDDNGNKGRYWKGTVYSCYVYEKALTDSEISAILNIPCTSISLNKTSLSFTDVLFSGNCSL